MASGSIRKKRGSGREKKIGMPVRILQILLVVCILDIFITAAIIAAPFCVARGSQIGEAPFETQKLSSELKKLTPARQDKIMDQLNGKVVTKTSPGNEDDSLQSGKTKESAKHKVIPKYDERSEQRTAHPYSSNTVEEAADSQLVSDSDSTDSKADNIENAAASKQAQAYENIITFTSHKGSSNIKKIPQANQKTIDAQIARLGQTDAGNATAEKNRSPGSIAIKPRDHKGSLHLKPLKATYIRIAIRRKYAPV